MAGFFLNDVNLFLQVQQASPKGCSNRNLFIGAIWQAPSVPCLSGLAASE